MSPQSAGMRRVVLPLVAVWMGGCVIRYGEPPPPAAEAGEEVPLRPVDFGPMERRLAGLVDTTEDVDARDRLELAWSLAEAMAEADPAAQHIVHGYLESLVEVEVRARPIVTPLQTRALGGGFTGAATVDSAELAGPEPLEEVETEPDVDLLDPMEMEGQPDGEGEAVEAPPTEEGPDPDLLLSEAARQLKAKAPDKAMAALEACRDLPCWETVAPSWEKARDAHVFAEKEALAVRFIELRGEAETERQREGLLAIQSGLSELRASWPESTHADDVLAHMARVQKELETLPDE